MYRVSILNACKCLLKRGLVESQEFEDKEEAKKEAEYMMGVIRSQSCQRHEFVLNEQFGDFTIFVKPRSQNNP